MMFQINRLRLKLAVIPFVIVFNTMAAEEAPTPIKPEEARMHVGEKVKVTFEVKASKDSKNRKTVFLDSEADFQNVKNLGIAISEKGVIDLKQKRNVEAPADFYRGKTIWVIGTIIIKDDRVYIEVDEAKQLDVTDATSRR
jgi:hypothetical protein